MSAICFMLIKDEPVYELEVAPRRDEASARSAHLVLHGALDMVDRAIAPASAAARRASPMQAFFASLSPLAGHAGHVHNAAATAASSSPLCSVYLAGCWRRRRRVWRERSCGRERVLSQGRRPARVRSRRHCDEVPRACCAPLARTQPLSCAAFLTAPSASCSSQPMSRLAARA